MRSQGLVLCILAWRNSAIISEHECKAKEPPRMQEKPGQSTRKSQWIRRLEYINYPIAWKAFRFRAAGENQCVAFGADNPFKIKELNNCRD